MLHLVSPVRRARKGRNDPKRKQINISIPPEIAERLQAFCEREKISYSEAVINWIKGAPDYRSNKSPDQPDLFKALYGNRN